MVLLHSYNMNNCFSGFLTCFEISGDHWPTERKYIISNFIILRSQCFSLSEGDENYLNPLFFLFWGKSCLAQRKKVIWFSNLHGKWNVSFYCVLYLLSVNHNLQITAESETTISDMVPVFPQSLGVVQFSFCLFFEWIMIIFLQSTVFFFFLIKETLL